MPYLIEREYINDYRCCCTQIWDGDPEHVGDLEKALALISTDVPVMGDFGGVHSVKITDEETSEVVALGWTTWPRGFERGVSYHYTKWEGHINGVPFETICKGRPYRDDRGLQPAPLITDRTWDQILSELREAEAAKRLKAAEEALRKAKAASSQTGG